MTVAAYAIVGGDYENGGAASRCLKEQLKKIGASPAVIRRAMIAAYEAEMNVVVHACRGELRFQLENGDLNVEVSDEGPGISDIALALQPGFSTASAQARELGFGAGMGLPNIKGSSDEFTIESTVGRGTSIRFTIHLKAQALYGAGCHSIEVKPERCSVCYQCLRACPTGAIRLLQGRPQILDYLCVDCTACIAACPHGAFQIARVADVLAPQPAAVLVAGPPALVQYGSRPTPPQVLSEMEGLGFEEVVITAPWVDSLREAVVALACADDRPRPVISPACPVIVNLIEMRFPALIPHLAAWESPFAAAATALANRPQTWVTACPCQRTELTPGGPNASRAFVLPMAVRAEVMPRTAQRTAAPEAPANCAPAVASAQGDASVLRVTGMAQVLGILERIEDGQVGDVAVVEPWACPEGCFGSPLWSEEPALARHRWANASTTAGRAASRAVARTRPYAPRPGLRLDADMGKAIQKLGRIDRLTRQLPGSNCGLCGAPTCSAFAEDVVLGRVSADACTRQVEPPKEAL